VPSSRREAALKSPSSTRRALTAASSRAFWISASRCSEKKSPNISAATRFAIESARGE